MLQAHVSFSGVRVLKPHQIETFEFHYLLARIKLSLGNSQLSQNLAAAAFVVSILIIRSKLYVDFIAVKNVFC